MKILRIISSCPVSYQLLLNKYRIRASDLGWVVDDMDPTEIVDFMESIIRDPLAERVNGRRLHHSDFEIIEK